jgi:CubicO group peptidase (beta-lactamase class C family)
VATAVEAAESAYFPPAGEAEWLTVDPAEAGFDRALLQAALDFAGDNRSSGVVVLYDGKILAESYWPVPAREGSGYPNMVAAKTDDGRAIEDVASAQKNIVSFLVGVAEGRGLLDLSAPVSAYLGEGWSKATAEQESAIQVEHLLTMTSGLLPDLTFEAAAGDKWRYNTNAYSRLLPVLEAATGLEIGAMTASWLTDPTGMTESSWEPRPWVTGGQDANSVGFGTTARDLARFGLLMSRGGVWNGVDLLGNPDYTAAAIRPSQSLNPSYGYLWWLNGQSRSVRPDGTDAPGSLIPSAPDDLYAAQGALGRKCYVVPGLKLVVTRLGDAPGPDFNDEFWRLLMASVVS